MHGHNQEGTITILFQKHFKFMFNKYIKQCFAFSEWKVFQFIFLQQIEILWDV
jgi:hypothetical protein